MISLQKPLKLIFDGVFREQVKGLSLPQATGGGTGVPGLTHPWQAPCCNGRPTIQMTSQRLPLEIVPKNRVQGLFWGPFFA
jgi:hypothetical protein